MTVRFVRLRSNRLGRGGSWGVESLVLLLPRLQQEQSGKPFYVSILPSGQLWALHYRCGSGYLIRFPELADFEIALDGQTVKCWPTPELSKGSIQHLHLNQVLPLALSLQGKLVFHSGAIEIGHIGIALMGESGKGKSTLTASFATNGLRFLTDDGLVLERVANDYQIIPSHASIRLWQDSEHALIPNKVAPMASPVQYTSKGRFLACKAVAYCNQPRPLRKVYFLGNGSQSVPVFQRISSAEALMELVKHSFLLEIQEQKKLASHFDALSSLVTRDIFFRIDYPRRYEDLPRVREAIIQHALEDKS